MKTRGSRLTLRGGIEAGTLRRWQWALSGALALALFAGLARPSATLAAEGSDTATEDSEQAARRRTLPKAMRRSKPDTTTTR